MLPTEQINGTVAHVQEPYCSWLRWCPTSAELLERAEQRITSLMSTLEEGQFVDIGRAATDSDKSSEIWTLKANTSSPNTPLVMIHGFGSGSALWCLNIDALAQHRAVYAMDILGFGRSSRPKFSTDALIAESQFVSSIEDWRRQLGLDKFILLGHSFGGFLAASYALKYPQRVSHLILADPWGMPEPPSDMRQYPAWVRVVGSVASYFNPLAMVRATGPLGPRLVQKIRPDLARRFTRFSKDSQDDIPSYLYHCNAQYPSGETAFQSILHWLAFAKYPMIPRLSSSLSPNTPITFIYGARSWVNHTPAFTVQRERPTSYVDVQILPDSSHHVYADRADLFNNLVSKIGKHTDEDTLPSKAVDSSEHVPDDESINPISKLYNVRHEQSEEQIGDETSEGDFVVLQGKQD